MSKYEKFLQLHHRPAPLMLGNVWDAKSAEIIEQNGFEALGTSSAAISHMLGYDDGENLSFDELLFVVKRIIAKVNIPLSVDIEGGYGRNVSEIIGNIEKLHQLGVAGINIEDSKVRTQRELLPAEDFAGLIREIKDHLNRKAKAMFINARTDTFILEVPDAAEETVRRARLYEEAGADGLFVPFIAGEDAVKQVISATALPVNVLRMPDLPSFDILSEWGVKRISTGNFIHSQLMDIFTQKINHIRARGSFNTLFENADHRKK